HVWRCAQACEGPRWRWPASSPSCCTECWLTAPRFCLPAPPPWPEKGEGETGSGVYDTTARSESRRRDDGSGQTAKCSAAPQVKPRAFRLAGRSSSDPIRWRPGADPGQKQDTGDRITLKGVDTQTPVTEEHFPCDLNRFGDSETGASCDP